MSSIIWDYILNSFLKHLVEKRARAEIIAKLGDEIVLQDDFTLEINNVVLEDRV